jgi:pyrroloquinoline quinone (PQQ) biosynthesis protein C
MTFPTTTQINAWFEAAHASAITAGGSVYTMEKYAEQYVVKRILNWAYTNLLLDAAELGYGKRSRISNAVHALLEDLVKDQNTEDNFEDDYEDDQQDDEDYEEDEEEDGEVPMTMETLSQQIAELLIKAVVK